MDWPVPNYPNLESTSAAIIQLPHDPASLRIQSDETRKRTRLWSSFLSFSTKKTAHPTTRDHLDRVTATFHPGCMGLPQELIEYIMDILQDDVVALKACSLACKSMYASTRHLIHQTLYLTEKSTQRVKAVESIPLLRRRDKVREPAKYWDLLASTGVLKYTRHVYIDIRNTIALTPHLEHLNTFDRVHMITIHSTDIRFFIPLPLPPSSPLYTTLSTLSIHFPRNPHVCLPAFIAQFPSLENLTLELIHGREEPYHPHAYPSHSPPLRGHLRCSGISQQDYLFSRTLSCDLPDGINFRSVEFSGVHRKRCQQLLRACKDNLEEFIVTIRGNGMRISTFQAGLYLSSVPMGRNNGIRWHLTRAEPRPPSIRSSCHVCGLGHNFSPRSAKGIEDDTVPGVFGFRSRVGNAENYAQVGHPVADLRALDGDR